MIKNSIYQFKLLQSLQELQKIKPQRQFSTLNMISENDKLYNFQDFSELMSNLNQTTKKDQKMDLMTNYFQYKLDKQDNLLDTLKLLTCEFQSPLLEGNLMLAENNMTDILSQYYDIEKKDLKRLKYKYGDLGDVAEYLSDSKNNYAKQSAKQESYFTQNIYEIIQISGNNTMQIKYDKVKQILDMCNSGLQVKYLIRILMKKPRIGISNKSVINALKILNDQNDQSMELQEIIKQAEQQIFGHSLLFNQNSKEDNQSLTYGIPIPVMLAKSVVNKQELTKLLSKSSKQLLCEAKYDGERTQIHFAKNQGIQLFSRRQEIQNSKFDSLVNKLEQHFEQLGIENCILEGEIVPLDENDNLLDFQSLLSRKQAQEKIFIFDMLMLNNKSYLQEPLPIRRQSLFDNILENKILDSVEYKIFDKNQEQEIRDYLQEVCDQGFEGLMIKSMEQSSIYKSNSRTNWTKLKKFLLKEGQIGDTLDLVPIAVYLGKGKRSGVYGSYLMGSYNPNIKKFEAVCKLGTGLSDDFLTQNTEYLQNRNCLKKLDDKPRNFNIIKSLKPDFWISDPDQVWEIQCDSFSRSPSYTIGKVENQAGISLRFPRLITQRPDKTVQQATNTEQIIEFAQQDGYFDQQQ